MVPPYQERRCSWGVSPGQLVLQPKGAAPGHMHCPRTPYALFHFFSRESTQPAPVVSRAEKMRSVPTAAPRTLRNSRPPDMLALLLCTLRDMLPPVSRMQGRERAGLSPRCTSMETQCSARAPPTASLKAGSGERRGRSEVCTGTSNSHLLDFVISALGIVT